MTQTFLLTTPGVNFTHTSDATWNNSNNTVEVIGAGAAGAHGASTSTGGGGGGGGAYNKITNFSFATPGTTTATCRVGAGGTAAGTLSGGDTWFNSVAFPAAGSAVGAKGGTGPATVTTATGGAGGLASAGFPTTSPPGRNGGTGANGTGQAAGGGGGGAGGPNGVGGNGAAMVGGTADGGTVTGGAAGNPGTQFSGTEFDASHGCGSGGGGTNVTGGNGAAGGNYGGGGGGGARGTGIGGAGANGIIVLTWTPVAGPEGWEPQSNVAPLRVIIPVALLAGLVWCPQPIAAAPAQPEGWQQALSVAPPVAKPQLTNYDLPPYVAPVVVVPTVDGWLQALSSAPTAAKARPGWAYVPYNTAQRSVNFTPLDWQVPLSIAPVPVKAQLGFASVPYNTPQLSVNFTAFGWQGPIATAPAVAKLPTGFVSSPYAQVATATLDWQSALSIAPPVRRAADVAYQLPPYITITPDNTVTIDKWQVPLSVAPPTIKAQVGFSYVPYDTAQIIASVASVGVPVDMGGALPQLRDVYYQSSVSPVYVPPIVNTAATLGWQQPLSSATPRALAQAGSSFVPFNTAQLSVNFTPLGWHVPLATAAKPAAKAATDQPIFVSVSTSVPSGWYQALSTPPLLAKVSYNNQPQPGPPSATSNINWQQPLSFAPSRAAAQLGAVVQPAYVAPVTIAGIAGMAWFAPLNIPVRMHAIPRQSDILSITRYDTVSPISPGLPHSKPFFVTPGKLMNI